MNNYNNQENSSTVSTEKSIQHKNRFGANVRNVACKIKDVNDSIVNTLKGGKKFVYLAALVGGSALSAEALTNGQPGYAWETGSWMTNSANVEEPLIQPYEGDNINLQIIFKDFFKEYNEGSVFGVFATNYQNQLIGKGKITQNQTDGTYTSDWFDVHSPWFDIYTFESKTDAWFQIRYAESNSMGMIEKDLYSGPGTNNKPLTVHWEWDGSADRWYIPTGAKWIQAHVQTLPEPSMGLIALTGLGTAALIKRKKKGTNSYL